MGVVTDLTVKQLTNAVGGIDTSTLLQDTTGQDIVMALISIVNALTNNNSLVGLNDVNISSPTNNQALVYDSNTNKWINGNVGGGSGSFTKLAEYTGSGSGYTANTSITLNDSLTNYDTLIFNVNVAPNQGLPSAIVNVNDFINRYTERFFANYNSVGYTDCVYVDNTTILILRAQGSFINSIYGIKY